MDNQLTEHLSSEAILAYLYASDDEGDKVSRHLAGCETCRSRVAALPEARKAVEQEYRPENEISFDFLTAQRQRIYSRIDQERRFGWLFVARRWATAAALIVAFASGLAIYEHSTTPQQPNISDAQLAGEVSQFAANSTPQPAEPISALFQE